MLYKLPSSRQEQAIDSILSPEPGGKGCRNARDARINAALRKRKLSRPPSHRIWQLASERSARMFPAGRQRPLRPGYDRFLNGGGKSAGLAAIPPSPSRNPTRILVLIVCGRWRRLRTAYIAADEREHGKLSFGRHKADRKNNGNRSKKARPAFWLSRGCKKPLWEFVAGSAQRPSSHAATGAARKESFVPKGFPCRKRQPLHRRRCFL